MKQRPRIYYSAEQKNLMWDRWQAGDSQGVFAKTGGIRPRPRSRSRLALTLAEREEISRGMVAGRSLRAVAALLGRAPSTVSREINRNGGRGRYRASK
jgi:IS30 family transposase